MEKQFHGKSISPQSNHQEYHLKLVDFDKKSKILKFFGEFVPNPPYLSVSYELTVSQLLSCLNLNDQSTEVIYQGKVLRKEKTLKSIFVTNTQNKFTKEHNTLILIKKMNQSNIQSSNESYVTNKISPAPKNISLFTSQVIGNNYSSSQNSLQREPIRQNLHKSCVGVFQTQKQKNPTEDFVNQNLNESPKSSFSPTSQDLNSIKLIADEMSYCCSISTIGLRNFSQNCFVNSSLQILIHLRAFILEFLMKYLSIREYVPEKKRKISQCFFGLCNSIQINIKKNVYEYLGDLLFELKKVFPDIEQTRQNDTQRFLRCLLDVLHKELCEEFNQSNLNFVEELDSQSFRDYYFSVCSEQKVSLISELFYTYVQTKYYCKHSKMNSYDQMLIVPLLCNEFVNVNAVKFQKLVDKNFSKSSQDNIGICEKCRFTQVETQFIVLPKFLFFSIQRTVGNKRKINFELSIEDELFLSSRTAKNIKYKLIAVNYHLGYGMTSGHYIADIKIGDYWYLFNDDFCGSLRKTLKPSKDSYTVVFEKV